MAFPLVLALLAPACGGDDGEPVAGDETDAPSTIEAVPVTERTEPHQDTDPRLAGDPMLGFGADLLTAVAERAGDGDNLILSPASVATALAMLEPGAVDQATDQLQDLLGIDDPATYHAAMNALEQSLETRVPGDSGELTLRIANAAYLQEGYPFEAAYLDTVGQYYGPVLNEVDYGSDPDAVAEEINRWVAEETEDRITDLIPDGVLTVDTVLTLINALYLNASWQDPFPADRTADGAFTPLDGGELTVPLMHGAGDGSARGNGWVAATKAYVGGLAAQFVLPDEGRFDEVAGDLPSVFDELGRADAGGGELVVPRLETTTEAGLNEPLQSLGLTAPFDGGQLLGITDDPSLAVTDVLHQTYVAIDEEGTEAAAATAIVIGETSAPAGDPVPVVLDRPFLFRIVDTETGATLFLGRIMDPTA